MAKYGITENEVGAPIYSNMDTVLLGKSYKGTKVYFSKVAYENADGIIVIARIG